MSPAELSLFFGLLADETQHCPAEGSDTTEPLSRAASRLGRGKLARLLRDQGAMDTYALAGFVESQPEVFGQDESVALAAALREQPVCRVARAATKHYDRVATIEGQARQAAFVPIISICALFGIVMLFCVTLLPLYAEALSAVSAPKPLLTRAVLYAAILFKSILSPMAVSGGLLVLVLVLYWRAPEGRKRLEPMLPRVPWFGELYGLWTEAQGLIAACLQHDLEGTDEATDEAALDLLSKRLDVLSARMVTTSRAVTLAVTLLLCALIIIATWLPIVQLHDAAVG